MADTQTLKSMYSISGRRDTEAYSANAIMLSEPNHSQTKSCCGGDSGSGLSLGIIIPVAILSLPVTIPAAIGYGIYAGGKAVVEAVSGPKPPPITQNVSSPQTKNNRKRTKSETAASSSNTTTTTTTTSTPTTTREKSPSISSSTEKSTKSESVTKDEIILLQKSSGLWELDKSFSDIIHISLQELIDSGSSEIQKIIPNINSNESSKIWATILAVSILHMYFSKFKDEWILIVEKANTAVNRLITKYLSSEKESSEKIFHKLSEIAENFCKAKIKM